MGQVAQASCSVQTFRIAFNASNNSVVIRNTPFLLSLYLYYIKFFFLAQIKKESGDFTLHFLY
jgi:hypothetical protein